MNDLVKENAEEIAKLYKEACDMLSGTNICIGGDIYFFKMNDAIANLSDYTVGICREVNNSNIHRGTYNIYLMCENDAKAEILQYLEESEDENPEEDLE